MSNIFVSNEYAMKTSQSDQRLTTSTASANRPANHLIPKVTISDVIQAVGAGNYKTKEKSNLRQDDAEKSVITSVPENSIVSVTEGAVTSTFRVRIRSKAHTWVTFKDLQGWIKDEVLVKNKTQPVISSTRLFPELAEHGNSVSKLPEASKVPPKPSSAQIPKPVPVPFKNDSPNIDVYNPQKWASHDLESGLFDMDGVGETSPQSHSFDSHSVSPGSLDESNSGLNQEGASSLPKFPDWDRKGDFSETKAINIPNPIKTGLHQEEASSLPKFPDLDKKEDYPEVKVVNISNPDKIEFFNRLKIYVHFTNPEYRNNIHEKGLVAGAGKGIGLPNKQGPDKDHVYVLSGSNPINTGHVTREAGPAPVLVISFGDSPIADTNYQRNEKGSRGAYYFGKTIPSGRGKIDAETTTISLVWPLSPKGKVGLLSFVNQRASDFDLEFSIEELTYLIAKKLFKDYGIIFFKYRDLK